MKAAKTLLPEVVMMSPRFLESGPFQHLLSSAEDPRLTAVRRLPRGTFPYLLPAMVADPRRGVAGDVYAFW